MLDKKKYFINKYCYSNNDTGSPEIQVILLTYRIKKLIYHVIKNSKDKKNKFLISKLKNKRFKLLKYLKKKNYINYNEIIKDLNIS